MHTLLRCKIVMLNIYLSFSFCAHYKGIVYFLYWQIQNFMFFQEVMKGVQMMYDITKFRRPSNMFSGVPDGQSGFPPTSPSTPALSVYTIDDEFNLPISVAFVVLVVYIVFGAIVFCVEEGWGFFESFYFVFISMSTIGFGDFVPRVMSCATAVTATRIYFIFRIV